MKHTTRQLILSLCLSSLLLSGLPAAAQAPAAGTATPDYLDPRLPVGRRVDDLVARMTLEEKVGQM
ncbi:MAG TPA: hypothetical protein VF621_02775, partial [Pyrinomonadaceae bacterium]